MGGTTDPMAFINLGTIGGLSGSVPKNLSAEFCKLLKEYGIEGERVYLVCCCCSFLFCVFGSFFLTSLCVFSQNFTEFSGSKWGHDGATF